MDQEMKQLLDIIEKETVTTSAQLASLVHLSEKTVRTRIRLLNDELMGHGAKLHSVPGRGFELQILDEARYAQWKSEKAQNHIPTSSIGRVAYILAYLLNEENYVKLDVLSEQLYVSRNTITADLKQVEEILERVHLKILRRPNYGIRVEVF